MLCILLFLFMNNVLIFNFLSDKLRLFILCYIIYFCLCNGKPSIWENQGFFCYYFMQFLRLSKNSKDLDITNLLCFILVRLTQVAGAAAASGLSLADVAAEAKHASEMVGTMGVALSVCTLPGQVASDRLGPGKMELGLGIVSRTPKEA